MKIKEKSTEFTSHNSNPQDLGRFSNKLLKKVEQGIIRTGMDIARKSFEKNIIGSDGKLTSTQKVYGKKYL
jgi:hypothetical protein